MTVRLSRLDCRELRCVADALEADAQRVDRAIVRLRAERVDGLEEPAKLLARDALERHLLDSVCQPRRHAQSLRERSVARRVERAKEPRPRRIVPLTEDLQQE